MRRAIPDRPARSEHLWAHVVTVPVVADAERILMFSSIVGEPESSWFVSWCARRNTDVAFPEDDVEPAWPDVVIVPGLAFTPSGQRLGQGGGWYDRFLVRVRADCVTIGVCFAEQIVDGLPTETHDVAVDHVVTDHSIVR